jgi:hypothetical protein
MPDQPQTTPRFSVRAAVAAHLGEDVADIERERRYQPTRTPCAVYSVGNDYLTATNGRKPKECDDLLFGTWRWEEIRACGYAEAAGWKIWMAK